MDWFDEISKTGNQIEYDNNNMRTKLLRRINTISISFDDKWFFRTFLGFTPYWADTPLIDYVSQIFAI